MNHGNETKETRFSRNTVGQEEAQYRAIVNYQTELICRFWPDGRLKFVNEAYCRFFGKTADELVGSSFMHLIPESDREMVRKNLSTLTREKPVVTHEHRVITKQGTVAWQEWTNRVLFDEQGQLIEIQAVGHDVTQRRMAEEALRVSEKRYRQILNSSHDHILVMDRDARVLYANASWQEHTGYSVDEINDLEPFENIHPDDRKKASDWFRRGVAGEPMRGLEYRRISTNGRVRWVETNVDPIDWPGAEVAVVVVSRDVTERKQTEKALNEAFERARRHNNEIMALLDATSAVLTYQDFETAGRAIFESCRNLIGASAGTMTVLRTDGQQEILFCDSFPSLRDSDLPAWLTHLLQEAYSSSKPIYENRVAEPAVDEVKLDNILLAPLFLGKMPVGLIGLANKERGFSDRDARLAEAFANHAVIALRNCRYIDALSKSEARYRCLSERLEETVRTQVAELRQADSLAAIGKTVSAVAHELRNPIQNVLMGLDEIRRELKDNENMLEVIEEMDYGIEVLNSLVSELLEYSRPVRLKRSNCSIGGIVRDAVGAFAHGLQKVAVCLELEREDRMISIDAEKMTRVLVNLISNAAEAMPTGGNLRINTRLLETGGDSILKISISDEGCGIDAEDLNRIYEPFFTTKKQGTGLGLPICRKLIDAHNGGLNVTSCVGKGTTVEITLPAMNV